MTHQSYPPRRRVSITSDTQLITQQHFKQEADINNILQQFKRTGIIQHINNQPPVYADLPDTIDYQQALAIQDAADAAFAALPSVVRAHFDNDPSELLTALGDPSQTAKLTELGILKAPVTQEPQPPGNPLNLPPTPTPGDLVKDPSKL